MSDELVAKICWYALAFIFVFGCIMYETKNKKGDKK